MPSESIPSGLVQLEVKSLHDLQQQLEKMLSMGTIHPVTHRIEFYDNDFGEWLPPELTDLVGGVRVRVMKSQ